MMTTGMSDEHDDRPQHLHLLHGGEAANCPEVPDPRAAKIVQLRLEGQTWEEIGAALRMDSKTVWRFRQRYSLDDLIAQAAVESLAAGVMGYRDSYFEAMRTTREIMRDPDQSAFVRLQAANSIRSAVEKTAEIAVSAKGAAGAERLAKVLEQIATEKLEQIVECSAPDGDPGRGPGSES